MISKSTVTFKLCAQFRGMIGVLENDFSLKPFGSELPRGAYTYTP